MSHFRIETAMGAGDESECSGNFFGFHRSFTVAAATRVDAFIQVFRRLTEEGHDVTVVHLEGSANPLNFSSAELAAVNAAGIRLKTDFPKSGFQIEDIVPA